MRPEPAVSDGYLAARARDGYLDAYELLVQRHSAMAYRVALRLCGDHHDAQDIAQEAFIAAWQSLDRFRADSSFSTWLYQIVTRRALNKVTRGRIADPVNLLDEVTDPGAEPDAQAERNQAADAVTDALAALPFPQRTVMVFITSKDFPTLRWPRSPAVASRLCVAICSGLGAHWERRLRNGGDWVSG